MSIDKLKSSQNADNNYSLVKVTEGSKCNEPIKLCKQELPDLYEEAYSSQIGIPADVYIVWKLQLLLKNDELLNDDMFLQILNEIKTYELDVNSVLNKFHTNNDGCDLLTTIFEKAQLKKSTKEAFKKYFEEELEQELGFQRKLEIKNINTTFASGNYKYQSDSYNVVQKNENILEITNLSTNEKRKIDFRKLTPLALNGINDIIALKAGIQKLPPDILFQIPEEVSLIQNMDVIKIAFELDSESDEISNIDGFVSHTENNNEFVASDSRESTLIHEIAHTIFFDKEGNDTLYNNPDIVKAYEKAIQKLENDNKTRYNGDEMIGNSEDYWSTNLSEYGAEVVKAIYSKDYDALKSLEKYSPECFEVVMKHFTERKTAQDKHIHFHLTDFAKNF